MNCRGAELVLNEYATENAKPEGKLIIFILPVLVVRVVG